MLELKHVSKTFNPGTEDAKIALDDLSLSVADGDFITIIGANGAGKSTLFGAICGTFLTDSGSIFLDGENITMQPQHRREHHQQHRPAGEAGPCRPVVMQPGQLHEARQERRRLPHGQVGHHPIFQYLVAGQQHGAKDRIPHNVLLLHMDFGYGFIVPYRRRVCNRRLVNTMQEMPLIFNRTVTGL